MIFPFKCFVLTRRLYITISNRLVLTNLPPHLFLDPRPIVDLMSGLGTEGGCTASTWLTAYSLVKRPRSRSSCSSSSLWSLARSSWLQELIGNRGWRMGWVEST